MIKVGVVEDDPVTRVGLANIVQGANDLTLVLDEPTVERLERAQPADIDLVILDLGLRGDGVDGADAVERLRARGHLVLIVSVSDEEVPVLAAIAAGANGYLTKEAEPDEILRAIRSVANGKTFFSATVAGYLLRDAERLTDREVEVLRLVASGETSADIAARLHISERTVNGHLERIRNKTGRRRKADLTRLAFERGIIPRFRRRSPDNPEPKK